MCKEARNVLLFWGSSVGFNTPGAGWVTVTAVVHIYALHKESPDISLEEKQEQSLANNSQLELRGGGGIQGIRSLSDKAARQRQKDEKHLLTGALFENSLPFWQKGAEERWSLQLSPVHVTSGTEFTHLRD